MAAKNMKKSAVKKNSPMEDASKVRARQYYESLMLKQQQMKQKKNSTSTATEVNVPPKKVTKATTRNTKSVGSSVVTVKKSVSKKQQAQASAISKATTSTTTAATNTIAPTKTSPTQNAPVPKNTRRMMDIVYDDLRKLEEKEAAAEAKVRAAEIEVLYQRARSVSSSRRQQQAPLTVQHAKHQQVPRPAQHYPVQSAINTTTPSSLQSQEHWAPTDPLFFKILCSAILLFEWLHRLLVPSFNVSSQQRSMLSMTDEEHLALYQEMTWARWLYGILKLTILYRLEKEYYVLTKIAMLTVTCKGIYAMWKKLCR